MNENNSNRRVIVRVRNDQDQNHHINQLNNINTNNTITQSNFNPNIYYNSSSATTISIPLSFQNQNHQHSDNEEHNEHDDEDEQERRSIDDEIIINNHPSPTLIQWWNYLGGDDDDDRNNQDHDDEDDDELTPEQRAREFKLKITCIISGMIIFASFGLPLLVLCGLYASLIQGGPTSVKDDQAMIIPLLQPCIIQKIWINCFVRQYTRVCYYQVAFNTTPSITKSSLNIIDITMNNNNNINTINTMNNYKSMITTPAYDIFKEPFKSLKVNDTVSCYINRNETKISIIEPSSEVFDRYQIFTILMGVFGGICCTFSLCSWVAIFAKSK